MRTILFLSILICLGSLSSADANPIPMGKAATSIVVILFIAALVFEVAVTMLLLKNYRLRMLRLALAYLIVNFFSFLLFFSWILPAFLRLRWLQPLSIFGAEAFVLVLETAMLLMLVNIKWFRDEQTGEVPARGAFAAVAVGNLASVMGGFFLLSMPW